MIRSEGNKGIFLVECINRYIGKYRIRWDLQPKETTEGYESVTFYETEIIKNRKPSLEDVKRAIIAEVNKVIDEKIISEFTWNGMAIWLSSENQFNYKAAYDLAVQTGGQTLPVVFKFGTTDEPVYHQFSSIEELSDFYLKAIQFISDTLATGWAMKDSIDWSEYEETLKTI